MRIVMMGTGPFAVPTFRALANSPHDVTALYTQPPRGDQRRGQPRNPMRELAEELGIDVVATADVNTDDSVAQLQGLAADLLVVCDYGQILSPATLAAARLGGINLHGSYLPRYRGAAPIQWALYNGDATTGVSVIHMTPRLDAGPCLVQQQEPILPDDDGLTLEKRLSEKGVAAVFTAIDLLATWNGSDSIGAFQDNSAATRARRLRKTDGLVDWTRTAAEVDAQRRAFTPWPGTYTFVPGKKDVPQRLILVATTPLAESTEQPPGTVVRAAGDQFHVAAGGGTVLAIHEVQPAGKRSMASEEYLRGHSLEVGTVLVNG